MLQRLLLYNWVSFSGNFGKFRRASPPVPNRNPSLGRVKRFQFQFFNFLRRVCLLHWTPYKQKTNRNIYWFVLSLSRIFIDIQTNINFGNIFFFHFTTASSPALISLATVRYYLVQVQIQIPLICVFWNQQVNDLFIVHKMAISMPISTSYMLS